MDTQIIKIKTKVDPRGNLSIIESTYDIPFEIKRIYYIWNNITNHPRGGHAHKHLFQGLIAINGSCSVLIKDGKIEREFTLDDPTVCLIVPPGFWRDMYDFSKDCVLLVLASDYYDEEDYIRNYKEYLEYVRKS